MDTNGDKTFDAGEPRTQRTSRGLVYSNTDTSLFGLTFKRGWNRVEGTTVSQSRPFNNYDLSW